MATTAKTVACKCSSFEFGTFDPEATNDDTYTTGCVETTTRTFAMGHDAKLVGFLVRAELGGDEIRRGEISFGGAVNAASRISEALAAKAQAQLDAAKARLAKKASKAAEKAAKKSAKKAEAPAPAPTHRTAQIKIGRWTYTAEIALGEQYGLATYTTKQGETKTATSDKYTEV